MKTNIIRICILSMFFASSVSATLIKNGDFSGGLTTDWKTRGDVRIDSGDPRMDGNFALIGYEGTGGIKNQLWQNFDVSGFNKIQISFDWFFDYMDNSGNSQDIFASIFLDRDSSPVQNITLEKLRTNATPQGPQTHSFSGSYSGLVDVSGFDRNARLRFQLTERNGSLDSWAGIDNVSVNPVPEPTTMLLFGAGLAGLIAVRRRKQK